MEAGNSLEQIIKFRSTQRKFSAEKIPSREDIEKIGALCHVETYGPGQYIFQQGEPGEFLYIIAQGRVFLERKLDLGTRKGKAEAQL